MTKDSKGVKKRAGGRSSKDKPSKKPGKQPRARAVLGDKPVSMNLVVNAFRAVDAAMGSAAPPNKIANPMSAPIAKDVTAAPVAVSLPPIPAVFPCAEGDRLHCVYAVANSIVAEAVLYHAPDENGDGVGDRMDELGRSQSSRVSGTTQSLAAGWSYLVWDFHPADQNAWTATLSVSINGGPPLVFGEASDNEASHHQAGMLIWAKPNA